MSVRVMSEVWELDLEHGCQGVLMAMADHADDDGTNCYPSVPYLAWKTGYSESQVRRIMKQLREAEIIVPVANEGGGRGNPVEYRIRIEKGSKKTPFIPRQDRCETKSHHASDQSETAPPDPGEAQTESENPGTVMTGFASEKASTVMTGFEPENPSTVMTPFPDENPSTTMEPFSPEKPGITVTPFSPEKGSHFEQERVAFEPKRLAFPTERLAPVREKASIAMTPEPSLTINGTIKEPSGEPSFFTREEKPAEDETPATPPEDDTSTTVLEAKGPDDSPPQRRRNSAAAPPEVTEEFRERMRQKPQDDRIDVDAEIDAALNHQAVKKAINVERYVQNWLRRAAQWAAEKPKATARSPATRPQIDADPDTFDFFGDLPGGTHGES